LSHNVTQYKGTAWVVLQRKGAAGFPEAMNGDPGYEWRFQRLLGQDMNGVEVRLAALQVGVFGFL